MATGTQLKKQPPHKVNGFGDDFAFGEPDKRVEFGKNLANLSRQFAASANHRFEFEKRSQLFIRVHNETLAVATMSVNNPDRSPVGINR